MQFIVIYGTRFIYGGQSRLPGDWEGAGLGGVRPLARKDTHRRNRGLCPILGVASPARASGFLAVAPALTKPVPPAGAHPPHP